MSGRGELAIRAVPSSHPANKERRGQGTAAFLHEGRWSRQGTELDRRTPVSMSCRSDACGSSADCRQAGRAARVCLEISNTRLKPGKTRFAVLPSPRGALSPPAPPSEPAAFSPSALASSSRLRSCSQTRPTKENTKVATPTGKGSPTFKPSSLQKRNAAASGGRGVVSRGLLGQEKERN